jgi:hypothetical protein
MSMTSINERRGEANSFVYPITAPQPALRANSCSIFPRAMRLNKTNSWPVILFLHGGGERGDGKGDLDYGMRDGPLNEAWIRGRDLPFVIIGPQLPIFDMDWQVQLRAGVPKPVRLPADPVPEPATVRPSQPMVRAADLTPL